MLEACRIMMVCQMTPIKILRICSDVVLEKIKQQVSKQRETRDKKASENMR